MQKQEQSFIFSQLGITSITILIYLLLVFLLTTLLVVLGKLRNIVYFLELLHHIKKYLKIWTAS